MGIRNQERELRVPRLQPARRRLARLVTEALAPTHLAAVLSLVVAWHSATTAGQALTWGLVTALFASVIPFALVLHRVRRGQLTDHHVGVLEQRRTPLLMGLASVLVGLVLLMGLHASPEMLALLVSMVAGLVVSLLFSLRWKISIHSGVAMGTIVILALVFGPALLALSPLGGVIGWARVELGDHTPAQVAVGAGVGATVAALVFSLLR